MKVISVAAPCNGSGKTSLVLSILQAFPGVFSAAKFTTIYREEQFCPVKDHDCACHRLEGPYIICSDPEVLLQPNTDTGKIWRAGAKQTLWCIARIEGYAEMLKDLSVRYLENHTLLLIEGNTVTHYLPAHLRLFVVNPFLPRSWWKGDAEDFLEKADWVIVNSHVTETSIWPQGPKKIDWSIRSFLSGVNAKQVAMENSERLDGWRDRRLYEAISAIVKEYCENPN
jgi:hypothetical protein